MRYMLMIGASDESEADVLPAKEDFARMHAFNEELVDAGVMLEGNGLRSSSHGARVVFGDDGRTEVVDGPFAESKELVAGYWILDVSSRAEAVEWARRVPAGPGARVDVRKVFEESDFDESAAEVARAGDRLRERVADTHGA
ncbi:YciI family protein [Saccharomonospora iraqiensis]|uniref:YciI family protein n=1 Tax=Saccharomonospora iraqiensis TaxID=52698 RepID=UPI00022DE9B9|nr:YciI family protein [Saccharomonospora iraqiensis]